MNSKPQTLPTEALYASKYQGKIIVIKASGDVFEPANRAQMDNLLRQIARLKSLGVHPVLIHGGKEQITRAVNAAGFTRIEDANGNFLSSPKEMPIISGALDALNRKIGAALTQTAQAMNLALQPWLSADNPGAVTAEPLNGSTGTVAGIDAGTLTAAAKSDAVPILHSIGIGAACTPFNINADDVACAVAVALDAERLLFLSKTDGILDENGRTISFLPPAKAQEMIENGLIGGGMKKKATQILQAAKKIGGVVTLNAAEPDGIWNELMNAQGSGSGTLITHDMEAYFNARITHSAALGDEDRIHFMQLQAVADLKGDPYLKPKPLKTLDQDIFVVSIRKGAYQPVGQCLLTDGGNQAVDYLAPYPQKGKTLVLTSLFMNAGHGSVKGTVRRGMGPTSILFNAVDLFAAQNGYESIIAKTNAQNKEGRAIFERMGYIPTSPHRAENEAYQSVFYIKEVMPVAP